MIFLLSSYFNMLGGLAFFFKFEQDFYFTKFLERGFELRSQMG